MTAHYHLTNNEETGTLLQIWYLTFLEEHPAHTPESVSVEIQGVLPVLRRWLSLRSAWMANTRVWEPDSEDLIIPVMGRWS